MNQARVLFTMVEVARTGRALSADDAIARLAELVTRLDQAVPSYEADVEALVGIGASIWQLQEDRGLLD